VSASAQTHAVVDLIIALEVAALARQQVDVHVRHGLPRGGAVLDGEGERGRAEVRLQRGAAALRQRPQVRYLRWRQLHEARHHAPRHEQHVACAWQRKRRQRRVAQQQQRCVGAHPAPRA
jgi:hypothetical protein